MLSVLERRKNILSFTACCCVEMQADQKNIDMMMSDKHRNARNSELHKKYCLHSYLIC